MVPQDYGFAEMKIKAIITEAAAPKVGRKYQHIEDLVLSNGAQGGLHAVERLRHMSQQGGTIELKWDGMPVVYWGRDDKGNFMMIPKNAWAYLKRGKTETASGAPTVMRSPEDVKKFVLGTGGGDPEDREDFANQFASLWPYFAQISPSKGFLEGGLLFYPGTKRDGSTAMPVLNKAANTYDFTPNVTTFHVPVDSELGKKIASAKMMVAATGYFPALGSSDEARYPDAAALSKPGIIVQGTTYVEDPVALDQEGLNKLDTFIKANAKKIDQYLAPKPGLSNPGGELYTYLNDHLRIEGLVSDFPAWAKSKLSPKKAETMLSDPEGLKATLGAVEAIGIHKQLLIDELSKGLHGGIRQTKPEGYAQAHPGSKFANDLPGQFIKTIDQKTWSPKESIMNKKPAITEEHAQGKRAVLGWGRGMGHTGHDALVVAVLHQAIKTNATPFFIVSRSFGKDDPIPPEMKLDLYKKKFPKYADMFSLPTADKPTLNDVLADLAAKGFTDVTLIVGADQKEAFGYLTRPDKSGTEPYKKFGLNSLTIMSRQDTKAPGSDPESSTYHEGPRATPMREVLLDPDKTEEEQFAVWRQAISPKLSDEEVMRMMNIAKQNLAQFHKEKPKGRKLKEFIERIHPLIISESTPYDERAKLITMYNQATKQLSESEKPEYDKDKVYTLFLDRLGSGPFDGGCLTAAQAIKNRIGGDIVVLVDKHDKAQHAVVKKNDTYHDFDGPAKSLKSIINRFNKNEMANATDARELRSEDLPDAKLDKTLARDIAAMYPYEELFASRMDEGDMKPTHVTGKEKPGAVEMLERALLKAKERGTTFNYDKIDKMMQLICREYHLTGDKLHDDFVKKHRMVPDTWIVKQKINENVFDWSDYNYIEDMDTRLRITEAFFTRNKILTETNDPEVDSYFKSLVNESDNVKLNKKCILVPLILVNDCVLLAHAPEVVTLLNKDNGTYTALRRFNQKETYPLSRSVGNLTAVTLLFNKAQSYNKIRTLLALKFETPLPEINHISGMSKITQTDTDISENCDYLEEK